MRPFSDDMNFRRQIPFLMDATYSVVKSAGERQPHRCERPQELNVQRGPPARMILAGWWRVFHQSTETFMIGILTNPTMMSTADPCAARVGSSMARLIARIPRYMMKSKSLIRS